MSVPWTQPKTIGNRTARTAATGHGQRHSVNAIESSTPHSAIIEPTERSIPPVIMTRPKPRLNMPYMPIWLAVLVRFTGEMNLGFNAVVTAHSTISKTEIPISFFIPSIHKRQLRCRDLFPDGQLHDVFLGAIGSFQHAADFALVHHGHAVAHVQH